MENSTLKFQPPRIIKKSYLAHKAMPEQGNGCVHLAFTDNRDNLSSLSEKETQFDWVASLNVKATDTEEPPKDNIEEHTIMEAEVSLRIRTLLPSNHSDLTETILSNINPISTQQLISAMKTLLVGTDHHYFPLPEIGSEVKLKAGQN